MGKKRQTACSTTPPRRVLTRPTQTRRRSMCAHASRPPCTRLSPALHTALARPAHRSRPPCTQLWLTRVPVRAHAEVGGVHAAAACIGWFIFTPCSSKALTTVKQRSCIPVVETEATGAPVVARV
eukprot:1406881-Pleurochrysis_carterae.AAC.1